MRDTIFTLLRSFRGLDALKRLFWQELNYDRVNTPVFIRDWPDDERAAFAGEPLLFAEHGEFKVIYVQHADALHRDPQRALINRLLGSYPYALFVFSDHAQAHWHFVNVKYERDPRRRRVFRRISVVAGSDQLRTAAERLAMLDLETVSRDLFGIPPLAIQQRHDQAFDVEAVTREFYREYEKVFRRAEQELKSALPVDEQRRLFTQRLFNRLMFIVFLERKGWLLFNERTDYLRALWEDYTATKDATDQDNFYWNRLYHLFFFGLNNPYDLRVTHGDYLHMLIGSVPYLNGGLFERETNDDDRNIQISDDVFRAAIEDLFYRFNFTIAESTPLDIEVAVDPEMLGKIFEELVTGRHESGSYYTPKPVVSFMCREGLKGFLRAQLPEEGAAVVARFVDSYDATQLRNPEQVLAALQRVTVCDPACGSGAYLLGMMQELLLLRQALFTARNVDSPSVYNRKLDIIQNNIYGVDKDPFATNIAQLRLWLSLIVDFERGREGAEPPTLPNLDYKIEAGDSLLGPDPSGTTPREFDRLLVEQYVDAKTRYLKAHGEEKKHLHGDVERLRAEIRQWSRVGADNREVLDWAIEFAEVFDDGGFDIVLANPPYVRQANIQEKPLLQNTFKTFYNGMADLYTYFYARALQMLKAQGMIVFISSNKWLRAGYGANLRATLANETHLETVVDFGDLPVFGAIAYPVIISAQKTAPRQKPVRVLTPANLERLDDLRGQIDDEAIDVLPQSLREGGWSFGDVATYQRMETMRAGSVPLDEYVKGQIYRGVLTGLNEAFVINGATRAALVAEDLASAELIKPFLRGRDVKRWHVEAPDLWLIFTRRGTNIDNYPAIKSYLLDFKRELEPRPRDWASTQKWPGRKPGSYKWYEIQDEVAYFAKFEEHKIIYQEIATYHAFTLDKTEAYVNNKIFIIPVDDMYLLGVLNSKYVWEYLGNVCSKLSGGAYAMQTPYVSSVPIPNASAADRTAIAELAQRCLDKRGVGCEQEESEINERVAQLYGLKSNEVQQ